MHCAVIMLFYDVNLTDIFHKFSDFFFRNTIHLNKVDGAQNSWFKYLYRKISQIIRKIRKSNYWNWFWTQNIFLWKLQIMNHNWPEPLYRLKAGHYHLKFLEKHCNCFNIDWQRIMRERERERERERVSTRDERGRKRSVR